jgi:hypothetical protein
MVFVPEGQHEVHGYDRAIPPGQNTLDRRGFA